MYANIVRKRGSEMLWHNLLLESMQELDYSFNFEPTIAYWVAPREWLINRTQFQKYADRYMVEHDIDMQLLTVANKHKLFCAIISSGVGIGEKPAEAYNLNDKTDRLRFILRGLYREYGSEIELQIPEDVGINLVPDGDFREESKGYIPPYTIYNDSRVYIDFPCFPVLEWEWYHTIPITYDVIV